MGKYLKTQMLNVKSKVQILKVFRLLIIVLSLPNSVHAQAPTPSCNIPGDCPAGLTELEGVFSNVIFVVVALGFIILLVMLLTAGFKYLTSGGEPKAVQAAHQTVSWALLGILFMAIAWLVLKLVFAFTGIDVTKFKVGLPS